MQDSVVFFGTGPVAAESLRQLAPHFTIEAVITKPRPAHHKGDVPVLTAAEELQVPVFSASNKVELTELFETKPVKSRLAVLIDFGIIVEQAVIDYFPLGIVNSHFSLLPEWRGADPITFSILSGQKQTGVSLMLLVAAMDEGPLLAQATYDIAPDCTTPTLTNDLIELSAHALTTILPMYVDGSTLPADQMSVALEGHESVTYSRKLSKADSVLDFTKSAAQLEREIRAFIEWPRSRTKVGTTDVIITKAHVIDGTDKAGKIWHGEKQFGFYTAEGILVIDELIPAGKKPMSAAAFLAGYSLE